MTEQIRSGIELMFAGMGIVFMFLAMLVVAINLMSALVQRYFPDATAKIRSMPTSIDKSTVAAISAAVHQYRKKHH
jgi:oxaloacetate decarboxylase (Na+ extruding) subunit gamma